ncbi:hypothetical protein ACKLNO_06305 [Neisseriaceae bacterium B1]
MLWRKTVLAVCLAIFSGSLYAKEAKIYQPAKRFEWSEAELAAEKMRRAAIMERTQNVVSLLGAEMALQQGDLDMAMAFYVATLRETKDPDVAERAMELAINARSYAVAEYVYQEWRKIEPSPSPAQRRMALTRALALGDGTVSMPEVKPVLQEANELQRRRLFLQLSQMSLVHEDLIQKGAGTVHEAAVAYPELAEASIADVLYSSAAKNEHRALAALQRLATLDKELTPQSQVTLEVLAQNNPALFNRFFEQNSANLPEAWRKLQVGALIQAGKYDEAQQVMNHLLGENPDAPLYIQAALLASRLDNHAGMLSYLEKAYQSGTQDQKSRAALIAATRLMELKRYDEAKNWANRVDAPEFALDKAVLLANLASNQRKWSEALKYVVQAEKMSKESSLIFNQRDVQRIKLYAQTQSQTPNQAIASLTTALKRARVMPDSEEKGETLSQILYQRGLLYADKLQQPEKAIADLREFVAFNPDSATGMNALGYTMLLASPQYVDEAFQLIQAAYQKDSESAEINDSLGWAYHKKGDNQSALPYLEFAYQKDPAVEVAAHLGEVYWLLNRQEDAKKVWQEGWQKDKKHPILLETLQRYGVKF